ncbi:MAG TPA: sulfate transporter subunit, partial [Gemmata sp.]|nr:sulfate transporter subunit [Gemmata sp.]
SSTGGALSVMAEPHIAVVDANVLRKGTAVIADAYVRFLYTEEAQELIARNYHRPSDTTVFARHKSLFPDMDLRRATTLVPSGKWDDVQRKFFAEGQIFDRIQAAGR